MHSVGPMCRYATDLLPMLRVLSGGKELPEANVAFEELKFYYCDGLPNSIFTSLSKEMANSMYTALKHFYISHGSHVSKLGAKELPLMSEAIDIWLNDMIEPDHPRFAACLTDTQVNLTNHTFPALVLAVYEKVHMFLKHSAKDPLLIKKRQMLSGLIEDLLGKGDAVLLFPSHPTSAPFHSQPIFQPVNFVYTALFNSLGFPVTQVPLGLSEKGLPLGVQVVAGMGHDALGIRVAVELERGLGGWVNFPA